MRNKLPACLRLCQQCVFFFSNAHLGHTLQFTEGGWCYRDGELLRRLVATLLCDVTRGWRDQRNMKQTAWKRSLFVYLVDNCKIQVNKRFSIMRWIWIKTQAVCVRVRACKDSGLVGSSCLIAVSLCWCESTEELRGERHLLSGGIFGLIHSNASKCGTESRSNIWESERSRILSFRPLGSDALAHAFPPKNREERERGYWSAEEIQTGGGRGGWAVQLFPAHDDVSDPAQTQACFWRRLEKLREL